MQNQSNNNQGSFEDESSDSNDTPIPVSREKTIFDEKNKFS